MLGSMAWSISVRLASISCWRDAISINSEVGQSAWDAPLFAFSISEGVGKG